MKMTTKMLAVAAMAVMAFAAFAVVDAAPSDDAAATLSESASIETYTVYINDSQVGAVGQIILNPDATDDEGIVSDYVSKFSITGLLKYKDTSDSWPLTVKIVNTKWTKASIQNVSVDGVKYVLKEVDTADPSKGYYIEYSFEMNWDETKNVFPNLVFKDNTDSSVVDRITFDMSKLKMQKFDVNGTRYSDLKSALDAACDDKDPNEEITVLKCFERKYNYNNDVSFGNGFALSASGYDVQKMDVIPGDRTSTETLKVVKAPVNVYYKATKVVSQEPLKVEDVYITQSWKLTPIAITSITLDKDSSEYNGEEQAPVLTVIDENKKEVKNYIALYDGSATVPTDAGEYKVTLSALQNFDVSLAEATWTIKPYDMNKNGRVILDGKDGLVYDGSDKTVTIVFDKQTADLFNSTNYPNNKYTIYAYYYQLDPVTPSDDSINHDARTVSGSAACTHLIKMSVSSNFMCTDPGYSYINLSWTIAQKSITDGYVVKWNADKSDAYLVGETTLTKGKDYTISFVSVERTVDKLVLTDNPSTTEDDRTLGTWRAVATGITNYSGKVYTEDESIIGGSMPVYTLEKMVFTEQGNSMVVGINPAIPANTCSSAELVVTYTTLGMKDGLYQVSQVSQFSIPLDVTEDISSQYVTLDGIFTYAYVTLKYTYDAGAPMTMRSTLVYDVGPEAWASTATVVIVDSTDAPIKGAVLNVGENGVKNGGDVMVGLKSLSKLTVTYMNEKFDVSNYVADSAGKYLFDGKKFVVGDIGAPTTKLDVSVEEGYNKVGDTVKLLVTDTGATKNISNFSLKSIGYTLSTDPTGAEDFVKIDTVNWTVKSTVACTANIEFHFATGEDKSVVVVFGNGGSEFEIAQFNATGTTVTEIACYCAIGVGSADLKADAATAYEGELVKITFKADSEVKNIAIKDTIGNTMRPVSGSYDSDSELYTYYFTMPDCNVTVVITTA